MICSAFCWLASWYIVLCLLHWRTMYTRITQVVCSRSADAIFRCLQFFFFICKSRCVCGCGYYFSTYICAWCIIFVSVFLLKIYRNNNETNTCIIFQKKKCITNIKRPKTHTGNFAACTREHDFLFIYTFISLIRSLLLAFLFSVVEICKFLNIHIR